MGYIVQRNMVTDHEQAAGVGARRPVSVLIREDDIELARKLGAEHLGVTEADVTLLRYDG